MKIVSLCEYDSVSKLTKRENKISTTKYHNEYALCSIACTKIKKMKKVHKYCSECKVKENSTRDKNTC